jgi:hypothetical protein
MTSNRTQRSFPILPYIVVVDLLARLESFLEIKSGIIRLSHSAMPKLLPLLLERKAIESVLSA